MHVIYHANPEDGTGGGLSGVANANNIGADPLDLLRIQEHVAKLSAQTS